MQRILAITGLTWKAAFRFRLFVVVAVLLLAAVIGLPILIKDDGTARGFTQILLTYTLTVITALLGLSTLWLACGTLARDIEECQMQMVAVKPIARWQIWLGKWLGLLSLNAALLALAGGSVYVLLQWRATRLPEAEQRILRNEVLLSRGTARPASINAELEAETDRRLQEKLKQGGVANLDVIRLRKELREQVKAEFQLVPSDAYRIWEVPLGSALHSLAGKPLTLRIKFNAANGSSSGTFTGLWQVGIPDKQKVWRSEPMSLAPDTFHEFEVPPDLFAADGVLTIAFMNPNTTVLLFPLEDGIEVLYPEGGFLLNFVRGLGIIFCWMALLAALGLAAASFLSLPVAAFFSLAVLTLVFSTGTLSTVIEEGSIFGWDSEASKYTSSPVDIVIVPAFKGLLAVINLAKEFSPVDALSTGRAISWTEMAQAFLQIVVLLGSPLAALGIYTFHRRELAAVQGPQ
jgi:hypothetical protein